MPDFQAREREVATDAAAAAPRPFRVSREACHYTGVPNRYVAILKGALAPKSSVELLEPGAFDECEGLQPWDVIEIDWGTTPMDAQTMRVRVIATPKTGMRRFERDAGLVERKHVIVATFGPPISATPSWGSEPAIHLDEAEIGKA